MAKLDLLLISPSDINTYGSLDDLAGIAPPLGLALIAEYVRERGYKVEIIDIKPDRYTDEMVAEYCRHHSPSLVGISSTTPKMDITIRTAWKIKERWPELPIILGGIHATALPENTLQDYDCFDHICKGEGFSAMVEAVEYAKAGNKESRIFNDPEPVDLETLHYAAWTLLPMERYRSHLWHSFGQHTRGGYGVLWSSLGCPYTCSFCSVGLVRAKYGERRPEDFVDELGLLIKRHKVRYLEIIDDLFTLNPERVHWICDDIIRRGYNKEVNMWCYGRVGTVDERILDKLREAGFTWIVYGFETGSERIGKTVNKAFSKEKIRKTVKMTHDAGLNILANWMFGFPDDSLETMQETLDLAQDIDSEFANFYMMMSFPGTAMYQEDINGLRPNWSSYLQYSYDTIPMGTKYLSPEKVLQFRDKSFMGYFSSERYQKRISEKFGPIGISMIKRILAKGMPDRRILKTGEQNQLIIAND
tara:strand:+ start:409 stop:1833 length:1425 start_codon:yes stop_codon:yes gene_type:complete